MVHSRDQDLSSAKQVVRTFSWKTYAQNPNDDLAGALVAVEAIDRQDESGEATLGGQWQELFDPATSKAFRQAIGSREESILANPTDELAKAYISFQSCLPKGHEARIKDGPPRLKVVVEAVATADSAWKKNRESTKAGRMKTLFSKVCASLDNHKDLFAVLPSGDKYVCLLTGSVSAIVQATINHDKIAEGVSNALDELSDDIDYWRRTLEVYGGNNIMKEYIARLYVVVFKFLVRIMTKWSSKSSTVRFFRSFDSGFFKDEIEAKNSQIRELTYKLDREGSLAMKHSVKEAPTKDDIAEIVSVSQAKFELEFFVKAEKYRRELGQSMRKTLQEEFINLLWLQRDDQLLGPRSPGGRFREPSPSSDLLRDAENLYLRKQIQLYVRRRLQHIPQQEHVSTLVAQSEGLNVNIHILERIQAWNSATGSQVLWVQGPFQVPKPSRYTLLSTYVLAAAQRASIPAVSYFCEADTGILEMVYSLILQTVELIPHDFPSELDFTSARFDCLDGTVETLTDAIRLLKDLLQIGPYLLFVIIDGLQALNTASEPALLSAFIEALRPLGNGSDQSGSRTVKLLVTTDGMVDALTSLRMDERLDALDFTGEDDGSAEADGTEIGFLDIS